MIRTILAPGLYSKFQLIKIMNRFAALMSSDGSSSDSEASPAPPLKRQKLDVVAAAASSASSREPSSGSSLIRVDSGSAGPAEIHSDQASETTSLPATGAETAKNAEATSTGADEKTASPTKPERRFLVRDGGVRVHVMEKPVTFASGPQPAKAQKGQPIKGKYRVWLAKKVVEKVVSTHNEHVRQRAGASSAVGGADSAPGGAAPEELLRIPTKRKDFRNFLIERFFNDVSFQENKIPDMLPLKALDNGEIDWLLFSGDMVEGLDRGVEGAVAGEKRRLLVPAEIAYGKKGSGHKIPAWSDLVFEVEVGSVGLDWKKAEEQENRAKKRKRGQFRKYGQGAKK